jgi:hypothetical protein
MVLQTENACQKKILAGNIMSVIVVYAVNIFQLSVKCQRIVSVSISVDDYGIFSKFFATLDKMLTKCFRLWRRRWLWHLQ